MTKETENKRKWLIPLLCVLLILCIGITIWAVFFRDNSDPITPDYPPQGTEQGQKPIEGDNGTQAESPEGGGSIDITYNVSATVSLSKGTVELLYANPGASNQNVAILIMVGDTVVAKSDLITPGHGVDSLPLEEAAKKKLQVGGYDAELVIRAYDPETGEKAMVDTKGEMTLTVTQ